MLKTVSLKFVVVRPPPLAQRLGVASFRKEPLLLCLFAAAEVCSNTRLDTKVGAVVATIADTRVDIKIRRQSGYQIGCQSTC